VGDYVVTTATHASYVIVDTRVVTKVPKSVDLRQAAFFNLAHTSMFALRRSQLQLGESCLVMGQGLVGAITAQLAKLAGASPIVATDLDVNRLSIGKNLKIDHCLHAIDDANEVSALASNNRAGGFDVVFEATGQREPLKNAFDLVGERGRVVMMSQSHGDTLPNFSHEMFLKSAALIGGYINAKPFKLYRSDIEIRGSWPPEASEKVVEYGGTDIWTGDADITVLMKLINSGELNITPLITHEYAWSDIPELYQKVWDRDASQLGVLINWNP
jgi:threonine dehydrogenase-like Zn-dependent dehydrogenase